MNSPDVYPVTRGHWSYSRLIHRPQMRQLERAGVDLPKQTISGVAAVWGDVSTPLDCRTAYISLGWG